MSHRDNILAAIRLHGSDKPVLSNKLENAYDISGEQVREVIRELRRSGHTITGTRKGYYYARTLSEKLEGANDIAHRFISLRKTLIAWVMEMEKDYSIDEILAGLDIPQSLKEGLRKEVLKKKPQNSQLKLLG